MIAIINIPSRGSSFPWKDNIYTLGKERGGDIWMVWFYRKKRKKKRPRPSKKKKDSLITFKSNKRVIALEIM